MPHGNTDAEFDELSAAVAASFSNFDLSGTTLGYSNEGYIDSSGGGRSAQEATARAVAEILEQERQATVQEREGELLGFLKNALNPLEEESLGTKLGMSMIPGISTARTMKGAVELLDELLGPTFEKYLGRATPEESAANRELYEARGDGDGNINALQSFLANPSFAGIPQIDSVAALTALQNAMGGLQGVVDERGFTDRGFAQAGRNELTGIFDQLQPGDDISSLLNELIGKTAGETSLFNKDIELREQGVEAVGEAFPGDSQYFDPKAFNTVANNILEGRFAGATEQVSNALARGNLSDVGASRGVESLTGQRTGASERLEEIGQGLRTSQEREVQGIGGRALSEATGFQLGDELFNIEPFTEERDVLVGEREGTLGEDFRGQLGDERLFDTGLALQTAGRGQVTSGGDLLNVFAENEQSRLPRTRKRGLGSAGSGAF